MKDKTLKDSKGMEIREGCTVRTKALNVGHQNYECYKVVRIRGRLCVQKRINAQNTRTFGIEYIQRWLKDESMEVISDASPE